MGDLAWRSGVRQFFDQPTEVMDCSQSFANQLWDSARGLGPCGGSLQTNPRITRKFFVKQTQVMLLLFAVTIKP